jgi:hypothetical protein
VVQSSRSAKRSVELLGPMPRRGSSLRIAPVSKTGLMNVAN